MTQVVVTDANNTAVILDPVTTQVVHTPVTTQIIAGGMQGPPAVSTIANIADVDLTNLVNGGILVYNSSNSKWAATNKLENQIFESGQF